MTNQEKKKIVRRICSLIKKNKTFFLAGHQKPDGDTVACELVMARLLSKLRKSVDIYNADPVPENLMFLSGTKKIKTAEKVNKNYDVAIIFECNGSGRMGDIIDLKKQAKSVINIDHHFKHSNFGDLNLINPKASSNAEQIYYIFEEMKITLTREDATSLYVGMITDTGRFQYSNTTPETFRIASKLLERGVDVGYLSEKIYGTRELSALRLLGFCLSGMEMLSGGRIACMKIREKDFEKLKSTQDDTEEIINYGLMVPSVLMAMLIYERKGGIKCSFRSKGHVNVCRLAEQFGGGGHKHASGCTLRGTVEEVSAKVLRAARSLLTN